MEARVFARAFSFAAVLVQSFPGNPACAMRGESLCRNSAGQATETAMNRVSPENHLWGRAAML